MARVVPWRASALCRLLGPHEGAPEVGIERMVPGGWRVCRVRHTSSGRVKDVLGLQALCGSQDAAHDEAVVVALKQWSGWLGVAEVTRELEAPFEGTLVLMRCSRARSQQAFPLVWASRTQADNTNRSSRSMSATTSCALVVKWWGGDGWSVGCGRRWGCGEWWRSMQTRSSMAALVRWDGLGCGGCLGCWACQDCMACRGCRGCKCQRGCRGS